MPPRRILPGRTWFVTRRTTRRHYLLRPDEDGTSQGIYWYATAVLAAKFGIEIHAVQVMSTHIHEVLTDTRGTLPAFIRERNRAIANALKCHRRWPEEVFQRAPASCIELYGASAVLKEIGYTVANCVEAGLVDSPDAWPGARTSGADVGRTIRVRRPDVYFNPENPVWPEMASITITIPPAVDLAFGVNAIGAIGRAISSAVSTARAAARSAGRFVGRVENLVRVPFEKRSHSFELFRKRNPHFACAGDPKEKRRARDERRAFLSDYRKALEDWRCHVWPIFPAGTWRWSRELLAM